MSGFLKLNKNDFIKGLVVAVLSAVLTLVLKLLDANGLMVTSADLQTIGTVALTAAVSYLIKNLGTDDQGKLGGKF